MFFAAQALQASFEQSINRDWTGTVQVATELGVSTFSCERRGELMLTERGPAGRADASLRLPQADLARCDIETVFDILIQLLISRR
jgi:hypothetical protein